KDIEDYDKNFIKENSVLVKNIVSHIKRPVNHIKITACCINKRYSQYAILDTINQLTLTSEHYSNISIELILNSKVVNWYVYRFIFANAVRTMHFDNAVTTRIPIPQLDFIDERKLNTIGNSIFDLNNEILKIEEHFDKYLFASLNLDF